MLAVTDLITYLYCPRKLYLQKVLRIKPQLKDSILKKGTIKHQVFEKFSEKEQELIRSIKPNSNLEEIKITYQKNYTNILLNLIKNYKSDLNKLKIKPGKLFQSSISVYIKESELRSSTIYNLIQEKQIYGEELCKTIPKYLTEVKIESSKLGLRGVIDKIEILDKKHIPIELKSGSMPEFGVWPGHQIQITSYIMLMQNQFENVDQGVIHYIDHNIKRKVIINDILQNEVIELKEQTLETLNSPDIPQKLTNLSKCKSCQFKEKCHPNL